MQKGRPNDRQRPMDLRARTRALRAMRQFEPPQYAERVHCGPAFLRDGWARDDSLRTVFVVSRRGLCQRPLCEEPRKIAIATHSVTRGTITLLVCANCAIDAMLIGGFEVRELPKDAPR